MAASWLKWYLSAECFSSQDDIGIAGVLALQAFRAVGKRNREIPCDPHPQTFGLHSADEGESIPRLWIVPVILPVFQAATGFISGIWLENRFFRKPYTP